MIDIPALLRLERNDTRPVIWIRFTSTHHTSRGKRHCTEGEPPFPGWSHAETSSPCFVPSGHCAGLPPRLMHAARNRPGQSRGS